MFVTSQTFTRELGVQPERGALINMNADRTVVCTRTQHLRDCLPIVNSLQPCVLITNRSDSHVGDGLVGAVHDNVRLWFATNNASASERVLSIPIGINRNQLDVLVQELKQSEPQRNDLAYLNFSDQSHSVRPRVREKFLNAKWVTSVASKINLRQYYRALRSHNYVLSPRGKGVDCYRHWESMACGAVPVVVRSPVTSILDDMPCLQVDSWNEVTEKFLRDSLPAMQQRFQATAMQKLYASHWHRRVKTLAAEANIRI